MRRFVLGIHPAADARMHHDFFFDFGGWGLMSVEGMRRRVAISRSARSHSSSRGDKALAFFRRWIWVSMGERPDRRMLSG